MHQLARLREEGDEPWPQLDLPSQHRDVRVRGRHLLQPGEQLAGLLHASRPGVEPSDPASASGLSGATSNTCFQASSALSERARACQYQALRTRPPSRSSADAAEAIAAKTISARARYIGSPRLARARHQRRSDSATR